MSSYKRNRSGNFTNEEIELLQSLVEEHKALVDSAKQEDKKKVNETSLQSFSKKFTNYFPFLGLGVDSGSLQCQLHHAARGARFKNEAEKPESSEETAEDGRRQRCDC